MSAPVLRLPVLVWAVVVSTLAACIGGKYYGFSVSGYAWFVPLVIAVLTILGRRGRIRFPVLLWVPWVIVVVVWLSAAVAPNALQRSVIILCPLVVGSAVSQFPFGARDAERFRRLCGLLTLALLAMIVVKTGILLTGRLPEVTGLAAQVMTGALLCTLYGAGCAFGERGAFTWWLILAAVPIVAVTRMGIVATGLSLPLTLAPMRLFKRVLFAGVILAVGSGIFFSERVQRKMFYSGTGSYYDIALDNPNLATSGRASLWETMWPEILERPMLGHGTNSSEVFVRRVTGTLEHPHNDWLRLLFDYGFVGMTVCALCGLAQVLHAVRYARRSTGDTRVLLFAGASTFPVQAMFMFTDNIMLYASFFGNLQFTILGVAYAAYASAHEAERAAAPGDDAALAAPRHRRHRSRVPRRAARGFRRGDDRTP